VATDYQKCDDCGIRVIIASGDVPPVDYWPDPAGDVAVWHLASGGWRARFVARGEPVIIPEKRHRKHDCARAA
jgi:hypothetical protein